jgi:hypothetical protein
MKEYSSKEWITQKQTKNKVPLLLSIPATTDVHTYLFDQNMSDGLPMVPPTLERFKWMLTGTDLPPSTVLGKMPPILATCTVANVAINSILAGCQPCHLTIVIAAVRAMLDPAFNLHGVHATTMGATPMLIINGSNRIAQASHLNFKHGALGSGQNNRANATIGRAVKLVLQNCGRAQLGGTESTTIGGPRKFTMALCENHEALNQGPWLPFRGGGTDCVTVHAVSSGLDQLTDTKATRSIFIRLMAQKIANLWAPNMPIKLSECVVIICPEHYKMLHESGISSKQQLADLLYHQSNALCQNSLPFVVRTALINQAGPITENICAGLGYVLSSISWVLQKLASPVTARSPLNTCTWAVVAILTMRRLGRRGILFVASLLALGKTGLLKKFVLGLNALTSKMHNASSIHIVVSGSHAGKFSAVVPGFGCALKTSMVLSSCVTRPIPPSPSTMAKDAAAMLGQVVSAGSKGAGAARMQICDPRGQCEMPRTLQAKRTGAPPKVLGLMDISKPGNT